MIPKASIIVNITLVIYYFKFQVDKGGGDREL